MKYEDCILIYWSFPPVSLSVCKARLYLKALKVVRDSSDWAFSLYEILFWEEIETALIKIWEVQEKNVPRGYSTCER